MTSYITITDAETDPSAPLTSELAKKWRDNPIAIAEGDATAPSLLPAIANKSSAGGVGTYMFASSSTTSDVAFGSTRAGSTLLPTSAMYAWSTSLGPGGGNFTVGSAPAGTWRAMGYYDYQIGAGVAFGATLWLRIS